MKAIQFTPANATEKLLISLPKECTCHMCETSKKDALISLGEKRFKEICKILGIYI